MAVYLAAVTFQHLSGKVEDEVVNTFTFLSAGPATVGDLQDHRDDLAEFYNVAGVTGQNALADYMSPAISRVALASVVKWYDVSAHLAGTPHGSPIQEDKFTLAAGIAGVQPLPSEVAVCLSFHAAAAGESEEVGATRPAARKRGRVFIGPLQRGVVDQDSATKRGLVVTGMVQGLSGAAFRLMNKKPNTWAVWSRKNAVALPVVGGFVDDAFDIQRRRGEKASTRAIW